MKLIIVALALVIAVSSCRGPLSKPGDKPVMDNTTEMSGKSQGKVTPEKQQVTIEKTEGIVSISELYGNLKKYDGKTIKVKGKVVKVNNEIMNRNWIHIQDGTDFNGEFDLTITTGEAFETGSVVTIEGKIALDKDFGYGYSYKVLLENGVAVKE